MGHVQGGGVKKHPRAMLAASALEAGRGGIGHPIRYRDVHSADRIRVRVKAGFAGHAGGCAGHFSRSDVVVR